MQGEGCIQKIRLHISPQALLLFLYASGVNHYVSTTFLCNYFLYIHIAGSAKHCRILLLWHFSEELKHVSVLTIIIFVKMLLI